MLGAPCDGRVSATSRLRDTQVRALPAEQNYMTTTEERTAADCSGYVGVDGTESVAVSVTPYVPPTPRTPADDHAGSGATA